MSKFLSVDVEDCPCSRGESSATWSFVMSAIGEDHYGLRLHVRRLLCEVNPSLSPFPEPQPWCEKHETLYCR